MIANPNKSDLTASANSFSAMGGLEKARCIATIITTVVVVLIAVILLVSMSSLNNTMTKANSALASLDGAMGILDSLGDSQASFDQLGEMLERFNSFSAELNEADIPGMINEMKLVAEDAKKMISGMDAAITETLDGSTEALDMLNKIDINSLNKSIDGFSQIMKSFSWLGGF